MKTLTQRLWVISTTLTLASAEDAEDTILPQKKISAQSGKNYKDRSFRNESIKICHEWDIPFDSRSDHTRNSHQTKKPYNDSSLEP
jgi:hypothetical protein